MISSAVVGASACSSGAASTGVKEATETAASAPAPATAAPSSTAPAAPDADDPRFHAPLQAIAAHYSAMYRADGVWWSPEDCRAPTHPAFFSAAKEGAHGRKMYTLFIKDFASYAAASGRPTPLHGPPSKLPDLDAMAQVIVKEAWHPVETSRLQEECGSRATPSFLDTVTKDGKTYRTCDRAGLFVMYRPKAETPGTDEGWVYGTVQLERRPDPQLAGQTMTVPRVTSAGRVESCMRCHTKAPHGRLFGLPARG